MSRELFGTDGVRGIAGEYPLDEAGARSIGMAVGHLFTEVGQKILIGQDTRESSDMIVRALAAGLTSVGVNVVKAGVLPTPGLAYLTRENDVMMAGIMVTASHNPYQYNGIKVFDADGNKLSDETEAKLNAMITEGVEGRREGVVTDHVGLVSDYEDFLVGSAGELRLNGVRVAIDMANGSACGLASRVYTRLGAQLIPLFEQPDGKNINDNCGATNTAVLAETVVTHKLNLGIALDGDADRLMLVDEQGRQLNGDHALYILATTNKLAGVVATVMSNIALETALQQQGITLRRTAVGDRYVLEALEETGFRLGGEQSGHIIFPQLLSTGDGLLASIQILKAVIASQQSLAQWYDALPMLPQALVNIKLDDKYKLDQPEAKVFIEQQNQQFAGKGRLLIRPSGTEPLARVMVEAADAQAQAERIAAELQRIINS